MPERVVRESQVEFNPYAICLDKDCAFELKSTPRTLSVAKKHARDTGHRIDVIYETVCTYALRDEPIGLVERNQDG